MGSHRRSSKFIFHTFRYYNSKIVVPMNPIQESISRNNLHAFSFRHNLTGSSRISQPIFRNAAFQKWVKKTQWESPFLPNGAKRFYSVDRNQVYHFVKQKGYVWWFWNLENAVIIVWLGFLFVLLVYCGNWETVPHTNRTHFVRYSTSEEKVQEENTFKQIKARLEGNILSHLHPENIRVQRIAKDIIEAFRKRQWEDLEGFECEVIVVDRPFINAMSMPGGKIVIFTGLLNHFTSNAEIATLIGHEVAHTVARHSAEKRSRILLPAFLGLILSLFFKSSFINSMPYLVGFLKVPSSRSSIYLITWYAADWLPIRVSYRKIEYEADYIGLLLVASAGYDPRVALQVHEKCGRLKPRDLLSDLVCPHPSAKNRAQQLTKAMDEALSIYKEVQAGQNVESFR